MKISCFPRKAGDFLFAKDIKRAVDKIKREQAGKHNSNQSAFNRGRFAADRSDEPNNIDGICQNQQNEPCGKGSSEKIEYGAEHAKRQKIEARYPCYPIHCHIGSADS